MALRELAAGTRPDGHETPAIDINTVRSLRLINSKHHEYNTWRQPPNNNGNSATTLKNVTGISAEEKASEYLHGPEEAATSSIPLREGLQAAGKGFDIPLVKSRIANPYGSALSAMSMQLTHNKDLIGELQDELVKATSADQRDLIIQSAWNLQHRKLRDLPLNKVLGEIELREFLAMQQGVWSVLSRDQDTFEEALRLVKRQVEPGSPLVEHGLQPQRQFEVGTGYAKKFLLSCNPEAFCIATDFYTQAISNGDSLPACPVFLRGLMEFLCEGTFTKCLLNRLRHSFLDTCHKPIEAVSAQIDADNLWTANSSFVRRAFEPFEDSTTYQKTIDKFNSAITVLNGFYEKHGAALEMTMFALKLGQVYQEKFRQSLIEKDASRSCELYRTVLQFEPDNIGALRGITKLLFLRMDIFGWFDRKIFQEVLDNIEREGQPWVQSPTDLSRPLDSDRTRMAKEIYLDLARTRRRRFEYLLQEDDIAFSLKILRELLRVSDQDSTWQYKMELSTSLRLRFRHFEDLNDLNEAKRFAQEALSEAGDRTEDRAYCLDALAKVTYVEVEFFETESLLSPMIEQFLNTFASQLSNGNWSETLPMALHDIGLAFSWRHAKFGAAEDIEIAISCAESAHTWFQQRQGKNPFDLRKNLCLQAVGNIYLRRHWRSSGIRYLDAAIATYEQCVKYNDPDSALYLVGAAQLGYTLVQRAFRTGKPEIALDAVQRETQLRQNAMQTLSPIDDINRQLVVGFACTFASQFAEDSQIRIQLLSGAIESISRIINKPSIATRFVYVHEGLASALGEKAHYTGSLDDYENAIVHCRNMASILTGDQWTNHLRVKLTYAGMLYSAAKMTKRPTYPEEALQQLRPIIDDTRLSSWLRVMASVQAAMIHFDILEDAGRARDDLIRAHELIPNALNQSLSRVDQLQILREIFDVPAYAVVVSLSKGTSAREALQLLERGRSVFWDSLMSQKHMFSSLEHVGPEAAIYTRLRRLSRGSSVTPPSKPHFITSSAEGNDSATLQRRVSAAGANHSQDDESQNTSFLTLSPESDGRNGPIVSINVHNYRSDALIITADEVIHIELADLKEPECWSHHRKYLEALSMMAKTPVKDSNLVVASTLMDDVLKWLWDVAAEPILDRLGISGSDQGKKLARRLWWVATKWIGALPIHAAGDHKRARTTGMPLTVHDRVVSSYIPTLRILQLLRQRIRSFSSSERHPNPFALAVAMPTTSGNKPLPKARSEIEAVQGALKPTYQTRLEECPKSTDLIDKLQECTIAHFACHTLLDNKDPSKSKLQLQDWRSEAALDVDKLLGLELDKCQLVFLSACETARNWHITEQSLHIAIGFLMAGVPNVIATLWWVKDQVSAEVATDFYSRLRLDDGSFDLSKSALAIHTVVQSMRHKEASVLDWAPYIHFGA